jgi:hypothetical protein
MSRVVTVWVVQSEFLSLSLGPQGALGFCALNCHNCASTLGFPVTTGSQQQTKIKGWGGGRRGEGRGASAGSLTRSAGNACQSSRMASPPWLLRGPGGGWVTHAGAPPHPWAQMLSSPQSWGSPNPHSGSWGHLRLCRGLGLQDDDFTLRSMCGWGLLVAVSCEAGSEVSLAVTASPARIWAQAASAPGLQEGWLSKKAVGCRSCCTRSR